MEIQEWMTRLIMLLMTNLDGDYDPPSAGNLDDTHISLFSQFVGHFSERDAAKLLHFYAELVSIQLEDRKEREENDFLCRDSVPRHLIADMVHYGRQRLT